MSNRRLIIKHPALSSSPKKGSATFGSYSNIVSNMEKKGDIKSLTNMRYKTLIEPMLNETMTAKEIEDKWGVSKRLVYKYLDRWNDKEPISSLLSKSEGRKSEYSKDFWEMIIEYRKKGFGYNSIANLDKVKKSLNKLGKNSLPAQTFYDNTNKYLKS